MDTNAKVLAKKLMDSIVQKRTDAATQVHPPMNPIAYSAGEIDDLAYQYQQDLATRKIQAALSGAIGRVFVWHHTCKRPADLADHGIHVCRRLVFDDCGCVIRDGKCAFQRGQFGIR